MEVYQLAAVTLDLSGLSDLVFVVAAIFGFLLVLGFLLTLISYIADMMPEPARGFMKSILPGGKRR